MLPPPEPPSDEIAAALAMLEPSIATPVPPAPAERPTPIPSTPPVALDDIASEADDEPSHQPVASHRFAKPQGSIPPTAEPASARPLRHPAPPPPTSAVVTSGAPRESNDPPTWNQLPSFGEHPAPVTSEAPDAIAPMPAPKLAPVPPPPAPPTPAVVAVPPAPPVAITAAELEPRPDRRWIPLAIGGTLFTLVVGGAAWAMMPVEPPPPPPRSHRRPPPAVVEPPPIVVDAGAPDAPADAGRRHRAEGEEPTPGETIDELILSANYNRSHGALDRADATYREVLAIEPRNQRALVGLARLALARHDNAAALEWARTLTTEHPRVGSNFVLLGDVYLATGDRAAARRAFEQALVVAPSLDTARERLDGL